MIHWTDLDLTDGYENIKPESARGRRALQEYRENESIKGIWLCTLADLDTTEDPSDFGPAVNEIDWTGFSA